MFFTSESHKMFYYEKLRLVPINDSYHRSLLYLIGSTDTTRLHLSDIYDITNDRIILSCLGKAWQTSGTMRLCRLAFNLYNGTIIDKEEAQFTPYYIFGCDLDDVFFQAIMIRFHIALYFD